MSFCKKFNSPFIISLLKMFLFCIVLFQFFCLVTEAHQQDRPVFESKKIYSKQFWHSYIFDTGVGNREELYIVKVGYTDNIVPRSDIFQWKSLQTQGETFLVGLGHNFLLLTSFTKKNDTELYKEDIDGTPKFFSLFQKWTAEAQAIQTFVVVTVQTKENTDLLKWYTVYNRQFKFLCDWPFHRNITQLEVVRFNLELKLLIASEGKDSDNDSVVSIYSFNILPILDIWLYETILLKKTPTSITFFSDNNNSFLIILYSKSNIIDVWMYSRILCMPSGQKHFKLHQKIYSENAKSVVSFKAGFIWHLAVASQNSSIYQMGEDLTFIPVKYISMGNVSQWLAVPLNTYREDVILLYNSEDGLSALIWNGNEKFQFIRNFTGLACGKDYNCNIRMKETPVDKGTTFLYGHHQNILIPSQKKTPFLIKLLVKLKPIPDEISVSMNELAKLRIQLEDSYAKQMKEIEAMTAINANFSINLAGTNSSEKNDLENENADAKNLRIFSQTKNWSDTFVALDILKSRLNVLKEALDEFNNLSINSPAGPHKFSESDLLPESITDGIVFDGKIIINNLNLSYINGYDMKDILVNSYRNKSQKVSGTKTFQNIHAENLIFNDINGIPACDIVFSDDAWETVNGNVINGDILWENKLIILNDLSLNKEKTSDDVSSTKNFESFSNIAMHTFDELYFEDLEITNESIVMQSINSRPMILPVHTPLDIHYLDVMNQARIELVNVIGNLTVGELNGKNFTKMAESLIAKSDIDETHQKQALPSSVNVLRAKFMQPEYINSILLKSDQSFARAKSNVNSESQGTSPEMRENLKFLPDSNERRNIYVFHDLEIDGVIFSHSVNNLKWERLNNTLKKGVPAKITGKKTFLKSFETLDLQVGVLNEEKLIEKIFTTDTKQYLEFPQNFAFVKFDDISLNGTWNGIDLEMLNDTLLRKDANDASKANLTVESGIKLLAERLKIVDTVNEIDLNTWDNEIGVLLHNVTDLRSVNASKVVVEGSLDTSNNVNNVNLTRLNEIRVSMRLDQTIEKDISLANLTIDGSLTVNKLNKKYISSIVDSEGDVSVIDQFLGGEISKVKELVVRGHIHTDEGVNNRTLSDFLKNSIFLGKANFIKGNITFENIVNFNDLNVTGTVNEISLKKLEEDLVMKQSHIFLSGRKVFPNLKILRDMKAKYLNGHLVQDIVTLMGDHEIKGAVKINGNVIVKANLTATENLNNADVTQLLKTYSTEYDSHILFGDLYLHGDSVSIKNLVIGNSIQNVSFDDIIQNAIYKNNCCEVLGEKSFTGKVKFNKNLKVNGLINDLNFESLASDIVLIDQPQKINGKITMSETIMHSLSVEDYFNSSLINDFDLNDWLEESVHLDGREAISGKMKFEKPVIMDNVEADLINGHMSAAVITRKGKQFLPILGLFQKLNVTSDVSVGGYVNGYNLLNEYENTVLSTGNQIINKKMLFHKDFIVKGDLRVEYVNGKAIANNLLTLDENQNVKNNLYFNGTVTVKGNISHLKSINGINLKDWYDRSVFLNRPQKIYGFWRAKGMIKAKNVNGDVTLNDFHLADLSKEIEKERRTTLQRKEEAEMEFYSQCRKVKEFSQDLNKFPYMFHQFNISHILETQSPIESVIPLKIIGSHHLIISFFNECYSIMYTWNATNLSFEYSRHVNIGPIAKWLVTYRENATYIVSSSGYTRAQCEENRLPGNIWVFEENSNKYVHLLTGNGFVDIIQENETANSFFTLEESGSIYEWMIKKDGNVEDMFLVNIGPGSHKFLDFKIFGGLAVSNGREVREIRISNKTIILNHFSVAYGGMVALPVNGKILVGVILRDKIVVYENIKEEKVFSVVQTHRAGSVLWFNYGFHRQSFLIVSSHHKLIEIFEYKSVSGFVKRMALQFFSMKLQAISLPIYGKHQSDKFVAVVQRNKIVFLRAEMLGDFCRQSDSFC